MRSTGEILKEYREKKGYTIRKLAEEVGKSPGYINDIEKERNSFPKKEIGDRIIDILKISSEDITNIQIYEDYKKTPSRIKDNIDILIAEVNEIYKNTEDLKSKFDDFKNNQGEFSQFGKYMNDYFIKYNKGKRRLINILHEQNILKINQDKNSLWIPIYEGIHIQNNEIYHDNIIGDYLVEVEKEEAINLWAIKMQEDSMEGKLSKGSIVLIKKNEKLKDGEIGLFSLGDRIYIRQLKIYGTTYVLRSFNPEYEDVTLEKKEKLNILGKVIEYKMKL